MQRISLFAALLIVSCSAHSSTPQPIKLSSAHRTSLPPIQHIVIVVQENRSFDNLFMSFPGTDTQNFGYTHGGVKVRLKPVPLYQLPDIRHSPADCYTAIDNGAMDGFNLQVPSNLEGGLRRVGHLPYQYSVQSDVQPYWDLAFQSTIGDRMFTTNCGPSFPAHQILIAGQSGDLQNPSHGSWGCDNIYTQAYCYDYQTLGDEMDSAGLSWRYYFHGSLQKPTVFAAYNAIRHIRYGTDWNNGDQGTPETDFFTDIGTDSCTLPALTWLTPTLSNSDHAGDPSDLGDHGPAWVASVLDALAASPCWSSTTILVVWDDWGGWYDHVPPPQLDSAGLGIRVPLLVIGPYAKAGYVSHVQHEFGSIVNYVEHTFGLPGLGTPTEIRSDDLSDCFTTTQHSFKPVRHGSFSWGDNLPVDDDTYQK